MGVGWDCMVFICSWNEVAGIRRVAKGSGKMDGWGDIWVAIQMVVSMQSTRGDGEALRNFLGLRGLVAVDFMIADRRSHSDEIFCQVAQYVQVKAGQWEGFSNYGRRKQFRRE